MCCSVNESTMSDTYIYTAKLSDGKTVLMYQNKAESKDKNAMILPVPSQHEIDESNFTSCDPKHKNFLSDYLSAFTPRTLSGDRGIYGVAAATAFVKHFSVGSYSITSCKSPVFLRYALRKQGLTISDSILDVYKEKYKGWPILICEWEGNIESEPIILKYNSFLDDKLFVPMLDSHDGQKIHPLASRSHKVGVAFSSPKYSHIKSTGFNFTKDLPFVDDLLTNVRVFDYNGLSMNDDMYYTLDKRWSRFAEEV